MPMLAIYHVEMNGCPQDAECIFEFESRKFRLIRGTDTELDKLCTILDDWEREQNQAYEMVLRLCDYWGWQWGIGVRCLPGGGAGVRAEAADLEKLPVVSFRSRGGRNFLVSPMYLPDVQNSTLKLALSLHNEARCSGSPFLSFINYWKILELDPPNHSSKRKPEERAMKWIDQVPRSKVPISDDFEAMLKQRRLTLGKYLYDQCRNAIVHVTRKPTVHPGIAADRLKIHEATGLAAQLAEYRIRTCLGMGEYAIPLKFFKLKQRTNALKFLKQIKEEKRDRGRSNLEIKT